MDRREEALVRLEEMEFTPQCQPLFQDRRRQKQSFAREKGNAVSWMISDFQKSIFDLTEEDSMTTINLLPMKGVQEKNVAIDSAWFESPVQTLNQTSTLLFSIHNYAAEDADNIRVVIDIDGQERPEGSFDIVAGQVLLTLRCHRAQHRMAQCSYPNQHYPWPLMTRISWLSMLMKTSLS